METALVELEINCNKYTTRLDDIEWIVNELQNDKNKNRYSIVQSLEKAQNLIKAAETSLQFDNNRPTKEQQWEEEFSFRNAFRNYQSQVKNLQKIVNLNVVPKVKHFFKSSDHSLTTSGPTTKKNKLTSRTPLVSGLKIKEFYENTVGKEAFEIQKEIKPKEEKGPIIVQPKTPKATFNVNFLMKAVKFSKVEDVLTLLKGNKEGVNCKDQFGWTPLMTACCAGNLSVFEQLLKWKPDVTVRDMQGLNCRDLAYKRGYHSIVKTLDCYLQNLCKPNIKYVQQNTTNEQVEISCFYCEVCKQNIQNVSLKKHLSSTVHNFNSSCKCRMPTFYGIPESNKGFQILVKSGWDKEGGLGPSGEGHKYPPKTILKQDRTGLGAKQYKARVTRMFWRKLNKNQDELELGNETSSLKGEKNRD